MNTTKYDEKLKPLFESIKNGDYNAVKQWIEDGNPVLNPESSAQSVLYYASSRGMFSILEFLLTLDWGKGSSYLNKALMQAVYKSHADNVKLLLEHGATAESVPWYKILDTYSSKITLLFLDYNKSVDGLQNDLSGLTRASARAFKDALPRRTDLEDVLIFAMIDNLRETYYASNEDDSQRSSDEEAKKYNRYASLVGLIRWIGCDIRKEIVSDDEKLCALGYAIVHNDARVLKSLKLSIDDAALINKYAPSLVFCDAAKMELLLKCGLIVNDGSEGKSHMLVEHIKRANLKMILFLANHGAQLPPIADTDLKELRRRLSQGEFPNGFFLALAKVLTTEQMKYLLTFSKVKEVLGDTPSIILCNLYDPSNSESPDALDLLLEQVQDKLKTIELHPIARQFRSYCAKSDRERPDIHIPWRKEFTEYRFNSLQTSKKIRPWIILLLNDLIPELEQKGVKFSFEEKPGQWRGNVVDVNLYAVIREYKIPIEFQEAQTSPKKYLSRDNSKNTYTGKLQFCHRLDGRKNKLAEEKTFLQFKDKIEYLADRLISVADLEDRREEAQKLRQEEYERERRERSEKEQRELQQKQKIEQHRLSNKRKVETLIKRRSMHLCS